MSFSNRGFKRIALIAGIFLAWLDVAAERHACSQDKEHPPITIEAIVSKWKERDEYFKSFVFVCNGEHFQVGRPKSL
jgi:hypothetical protein